MKFINFYSYMYFSQKVVFQFLNFEKLYNFINFQDT